MASRWEDVVAVEPTEIGIHTTTTSRRVAEALHGRETPIIIKTAEEKIVFQDAPKCRTVKKGQRFKIISGPAAPTEAEAGEASSTRMAAAQMPL